MWVPKDVSAYLIAMLRTNSESALEMMMSWCMKEGYNAHTSMKVSDYLVMRTTLCWGMTCCQNTAVTTQLKNNTTEVDVFC